MGILRADRVSGLGGANAITGSVYFKGAQNLRTSNTADLRMGSSDLTVECWWYTQDLGTDINFVSLWNSSSNKRSWGLYWDADTDTLYFNGSSDGTNSDMSQSVSWTPSKNTWYHIAATKIGTTIALYVDGSSLVSSAKSGTYYENTDDPIVIGGQMAGTNYNSKILRGYMSNLRIIKGEGIYTGAFTVPAQRLEKTVDTVLLCCQSPGDITQEATGKTLIPYRISDAYSYPAASHFTPDVGEDHGTTFEDNTKFDTLSYMVPPGGTTAESNRGRGVYDGASNAETSAALGYIEIQSMGISKDFGDLGRSLAGKQMCSSSTRGLDAGGGPSPAYSNTIEYITIATTANAINFGDMTEAVRGGAALANSTRGLFGGGINPSGQVDTIGYVTIATTGNASDFGNLTAAAYFFGDNGLSSSTRGIWGGGAPIAGNTIQYVTIASTGNATDFGDLTDARNGMGSGSNSTRGIFAGGYEPNFLNVIDYITIASTGNAVDFGDLPALISENAGMSNSTRLVLAGGESPTYGSPSNAINIMNYVTIATLGNAEDFGDTFALSQRPRGCSDSHGGVL